MDSSDCEAVHTTQEEVCRDPRAPSLDPLSIRLGLRQYADFVVNLQGLATRDKEGEGAPVSREENLSSPWSAGVWPWAPVYRGNEMFNCQQCPKTFNSPVSLDIHIRRAHSPVTKPCDPCSVDGEKGVTQPPSFTTVSPARTEKTFQVRQSSAESPSTRQHTARCSLTIQGHMAVLSVSFSQNFTIVRHYTVYITHGNTDESLDINSTATLPTILSNALLILSKQKCGGA